MYQAPTHIQAFIRILQESRVPHFFNPWSERSPEDRQDVHAPDKVRSLNLAQSLDLSRARLILVGEHTTYYDAHFSGIPLVSEYMACSGLVPRVAPYPQLSNLSSQPHHLVLSDLWNALLATGLLSETIFWNLQPLFPSVISETVVRSGPDKGKTVPRIAGRALSGDELLSHLKFTEWLCDMHPQAKIISLTSSVADAIDSTMPNRIKARHSVMPISKRKGKESSVSGMVDILSGLDNPAVAVNGVSAKARVAAGA